LDSKDYDRNVFKIPLIVLNFIQDSMMILSWLMIRKFASRVGQWPAKIRDDMDDMDQVNNYSQTRWKDFS
jgi:hypothetical protein